MSPGAAIWVAGQMWCSPGTQKMGSFCPLTRVVMPSMLLIPVDESLGIPVDRVDSPPLTSRYVSVTGWPAVQGLTATVEGTASGSW